MLDLNQMAFLTQLSVVQPRADIRILAFNSLQLVVRHNLYADEICRKNMLKSAIPVLEMFGNRAILFCRKNPRFPPIPTRLSLPHTPPWPKSETDVPLSDTLLHLDMSLLDLKHGCGDGKDKVKLSHLFRKVAN
jgi:hypothetical protein